MAMYSTTSLRAAVSVFVLVGTSLGQFRVSRNWPSGVPDGFVPTSPSVSSVKSI